MTSAHLHLWIHTELSKGSFIEGEAPHRSHTTLGERPASARVTRAPQPRTRRQPLAPLCETPLSRSPCFVRIWVRMTNIEMCPEPSSLQARTHRRRSNVALDRERSPGQGHSW